MRMRMDAGLSRYMTLAERSEWLLGALTAATVRQHPHKIFPWFREDLDG